MPVSRLVGMRLSLEVTIMYLLHSTSVLSSKLNYASRTLRHHRGFTIPAILTIALGVGVNSAVFGLVYSVLLHELPFRRPELLVQLGEKDKAHHTFQVTYPDSMARMHSTKSFEKIAAYTFEAMNKRLCLGRASLNRPRRQWCHPIGSEYPVSRF